MKAQKLFWRVIWSVLAVLLLVGCGSPTEEQIVVTFDGNECTVSGPSELAVGVQPFIFINSTEKTLSFNVNQLLDGHTYQDLVDRINQQGSKLDSGGADTPEWFSMDVVVFVGIEKDETTGDETISLRIKKEGDYAIYLYDALQQTIYLCGPLTMVEAPPE